MDVLKLRWTLWVIIAMEAIFLFLFILYRLDLIDLKMLVTLVVVEMVGGVLAYIFSRWGKENDREAKSKNKKREILEDYVRKHNQDLINTIIKDWFGEQKPLSLTNEQLATEHLRTGYYPLWRLWFEECKTLKNHISEDKKIISEYIKNKSSEGAPLYSELEEIFESQISQDAMGNITFVNPDEEQIYKLLDDFATKGQLPNNDFKEFIEIIIKNKPLYERFEAVTKNKAYLIEKISKFEQGLEKIVSDFEKWGAELKGTCGDCKAKHKELDSLK